MRGCTCAQAQACRKAKCGPRGETRNDDGAGGIGGARPGSMRRAPLSSTPLSKIPVGPAAGSSRIVSARLYANSPAGVHPGPLACLHFRKSPSAPRQEPAVSSRHVCTQTARRVSSARAPCAPLRAMHIAPWLRSRAPRRICGSRTRRRRPAEPRRAPCCDIACGSSSSDPHYPSLVRLRRRGNWCA